jgi:hypothetical protein
VIANRSAVPARRPSTGLFPTQIRVAIPLPEARIAELEALSVETINSRHHPSVFGLQSAILSTLNRIFGADTGALYRLRAAAILDTTKYTMPIRVGGGPRRASVQEIQRGVEQGRQRSTTLLRQEVALMKEQLGEDEDHLADRAIRAYSNLDLHPEIARAASPLYQDGITPTPSKMRSRRSMPGYATAAVRRSTARR